MSENKQNSEITSASNTSTVEEIKKIKDPKLLGKVLILNLPGLTIKTGSRWFNTTKKGAANLIYYPYPWFMGYGTALFKKHGFEAVMKDAVAMEWTADQTRDYINELKPAYIICEPTSVSLDEDREFLLSLDKNIKKIAVGNLATNFTLECLNFVDMAVVGEWEFPILEFLESGGTYLPDPFASKEKRNFRRAPLIDDLDEFPWPERYDTPYEFYNEPSCYGKNMVMISSRGCRLKCAFCIIEDVYGKHVYRTRSPKDIVDEMDYLWDNFDIDEIYFDDDNMVSKKDHIDAICREIIDRGLGKKLKWLCMGDGLLDNETLELLSKAGCVTYKWGLEHLDPEVLRAIPKPLKKERQLELIRKCHELGMRAYTNLIVGLPMSTREKDMELLETVINAGPDLIQIAIATPIRGTKFHRDAVANGWIKNEKMKFDITGESVVSYPNYSSKDITEVFHEGWRMWYKHVMFKQQSTLWFFYTSEVRRNGFVSATKKAIAYLLKAFKIG